MDFVSDDYLAVGFDPEPRTYRLYSTAKLDPRTLSLYPELAARCRTYHQTGFDKVVLFLEDGYREQLKDSLRLDLALRPWISGDSDTVLGKTEPLEIENALASETLGHLPHVGAGTVQFLNRVSTQVPRAAIHLGTERAGIPNVIRNALASGVGGELSRGCAERLQPYVSVMVHFHREDLEELKTLAADVEGQGYPRTEFIVVASGPACAMQDEASKLPGTVRIFTYPEAIVNAEAWNRGVREAFAELLILIEPGDRFPAGALEALAVVSELDSRAAWVRGKTSRDNDESFGPLRGALLRKTAFRQCGVFPTEPFFQGREQLTWLHRAEATGLAGSSIDAVTLHAAGAAAQKAGRLMLRPDFNFLIEELIRRQGKKLE